MVELCIMASSSTSVPGLFHQEQGLLYKSNKECLSIVPCNGRKQESMLRFQLSSSSPPLVGDPMKPMGWLFSDQSSTTRVVDPTTKNSLLIHVQDAHPNSVHLSFGISENCTRRENMLRYLLSGSNEPMNNELDFSVISSLTGIQTAATEMRLRSLYEVRGSESHPSLMYPSQLRAPKTLLDPMVQLARSNFTVHPDGGVLFTGTDIEMKDVLSVFTEFHLSNNWRKQPMLVPHFPRLDTDESYFNIRAPPMKAVKAELLTYTPMKSPETIKLKPTPKKRSSKRAGRDQELREQDLCRRSNFHAFETLLSLVLDKNRGKSAILSVKKSGPELSQLLTKFSAGIAGTGLAVLFSVVCKVSSGRTPIYASTVLNTGFGSALVWLSWAVNKLRDTVVCISRNSSKPSVNEKEMMRKVDKNVNEIFLRAVTVMAVVVLRFA
ncbi:hypothetical protein ACHQM5_026975 [Ranunculus cassubicifolius]